MIIDCDSCVMQHTDACDDCVVTAILAADDAPLDLDPEEAAALDSMAELGLVPTLRLVPKRRAG